MGTNYYLRRKIPLAKLKRIKDMVTEDNIYDGKLDSELNQFPEIHIGKSSAGWQFLFNHNNGKYYEKTQASINNFLKEEVARGGKFVDEYGELQDIDDFWGFVMSKKNGFDGKSYYEYEKQRWEEYQVNPEKFEDDLFKPHAPVNWNIDHPETFSDDEWHLRFSDSTEFC